ncbi:tripartite tricarboxylate transporter TctB family protein [Aidingimonas lacisalsi]|uniref:tripartite tricarboxylate transporter TctB family protein n=1 Tax=Aidingimonas lacisalsi TaxID=2604086 RepID=UPI0011D23C4F|nr:tripartite tricarboxylate transporter TctB family protein [Aidingimonas lacisalsi]
MNAKASSQTARSTDRANAWAHIVLNGALALLFAYLFLRAGSLPESAWEPLGAGTFPRLILAVLILLNLGIVAKQVPRAVHSPRLPAGSTRQWLWRHRLAFGVLGLFGAYTLTVPLLGFRLASFAFLMLVQYLLGARRWRSLLIALAIALTFSFGIYALFQSVFSISLPSGILG